MKLNPKSQLALRMTTSAVESMFNLQYEKYISKCSDEKLRNDSISHWAEMFCEEFGGNSTAIKMSSGIDLKRMKNKNYLMAQPALAMLKRIKIDEDKFDIRFLSKIPDKKITFLLGKNTMIRYMKQGNNIFAVKVSTEPMANGSEYLTYVSFKIDIDQDFISYTVNPEAPLSDPNFIFFLQLLIFTELSELEIKIVNPKSKTSGTRSEGKYVNESNQSVIVVDSSWNKVTIRKDGFAVRGHLRLQPKGKERMDRELIFIEEFEKDGYVRRPKKETSEEVN